MSTDNIVSEYKNAHTEYRRMFELFMKNEVSFEDYQKSSHKVYQYMNQLKLYQEMGRCDSEGCDHNITYFAHADKGFAVFCDKCRSENYWVKTIYA